MFRRFRRSDEVVALAFSGGGTRGASQVGSLRALGEAGIWPQLVAGTSVGSLNAVHAAMYPQQIDHLEALWLALRTKDVFPSSKLRILLNVTRSGFVHRADAWERFLRGHLADACFEDLSLPCAVVAVRLDDGARIVFDSGPILPALMASTAIPGIFPPYRMGDAHFVDGGLVEYMPVPSLIERGATTIYGLDCSHVGADFSETRRIIDRCARIAAQSWVGSATTLPASRGRTIHVLRPELPELANGTDFGRTAELMLMGYRHAREYIRAHELERSVESESSAG